MRFDVVSKQRTVVVVLVFLGLTPFRIAAADNRAVSGGIPSGDTQPPELQSEPNEPLPTDAELEQAGAVFGDIRIDNKDVFDKNNPKDNKALFRLADKLHVRTRPSVIRHQLLFRPGDRYSRHAIEESARILRADRYFYDASIVPVRYHDGKVDVLVTTRDVWTLDPGLNFGRSGGTNSTGATLQELNILGTGSAVSIGHQTGVDRSGSSIGLADTHAFGTWTTVALNYAELSDGSFRSALINSPFYSLDTHWAGGVLAQDADQVDSLYDRGQIIDQFRDHGVFAQAYAGWSPGLQNDWVNRWSAGVTYDERLFTVVPTWTGATLLPEDRKFVYPWVRYERLEDDYVKLQNHDQIGRTEDFFLGTDITLLLGWADAAFGSSRSALLFQASAGRGMMPSDSTTILMTSAFTGRVEDGTLYNGVLDGAIRYYVQQSKNWLLFTTLHADNGWRLDVDHQILLGGDNGLRGYPLRYQDGSGRALFSAEERYFTDWYPFRLVRVGAAVFFDAGRTWGSAPLASPSLGFLEDAGFGLRFGNARSGFGNVVHVDIAFPLVTQAGIDKAQFLVQTQASF
jgi:outer membrane protein assembly factor BamA